MFEIGPFGDKIVLQTPKLARWPRLHSAIKQKPATPDAIVLRAATCSLLLVTAHHLMTSMRCWATDTFCWECINMYAYLYMPIYLWASEGANFNYCSKLKANSTFLSLTRPITLVASNFVKMCSKTETGDIHKRWCCCSNNSYLNISKGQQTWGRNEILYTNPTEKKYLLLSSHY